MNSKTLITILLVSVFAFGFGWVLHEFFSPLKGSQGKDQDNNFMKEVSTADTIEINKLNSNATTISGRYILAGSKCAGFDFISKSIILWTNEIACHVQDTLRIRWLDNSTFMTRSTERINENCPPRVDIYQVKSFDGKSLILKTIWTGWNDLKDDQLELNKQSAD